MSINTSMDKLKEIEELLRYIPAKSVDEYSNTKKNTNSSNFKLNNTNMLSINEISNKLHDKINNFNTNKGKTRTMSKPKNNDKDQEMKNVDKSIERKKVDKSTEKKNKDKSTEKKNKDKSKEKRNIYKSTEKMELD